jgi:hypothetical protein
MSYRCRGSQRSPAARPRRCPKRCRSRAQPGCLAGYRDRASLGRRPFGSSVVTQRCPRLIRCLLRSICGGSRVPVTDGGLANQQSRWDPFYCHRSGPSLGQTSHRLRGLLRSCQDLCAEPSIAGSAGKSRNDPRSQARYSNGRTWLVRANNGYGTTPRPTQRTTRLPTTSLAPKVAAPPPTSSNALGASVTKAAGSCL